MNQSALHPRDPHATCWLRVPQESKARAAAKVKAQALHDEQTTDADRADAAEARARDRLRDQLSTSSGALSAQMSAKGSMAQKFLLERTAVPVPYLFDIVDESELSPFAGEIDAHALTAADVNGPEAVGKAIEERKARMQQSGKRAVFRTCR